MNRPRTSTKIESVILKVPTSKSPGPDGFIGKFYQIFREKLTLILLKLSPQKTYRGRNTSELILWGQYHPDTKTRHRYFKKEENYKPISLMNIDVKILKKILGNWVQQYIKRIVPNEHVWFIPGVQGFFQYM